MCQNHWGKGPSWLLLLLFHWLIMWGMICKAELNACLPHIAMNNPFVWYNRRKPVAELCHAKTGLNHRTRMVIYTNISLTSGFFCTLRNLFVLSTLTLKRNAPWIPWLPLWLLDGSYLITGIFTKSIGLLKCATKLTYLQSFPKRNAIFHGAFLLRLSVLP